MPMKEKYACPSHITQDTQDTLCWAHGHTQLLEFYLLWQSGFSILPPRLETALEIVFVLGIPIMSIHNINHSSLGVPKFSCCVQFHFSSRSLILTFNDSDTNVFMIFGDTTIKDDCYHVNAIETLQKDKKVNYFAFISQVCGSYCVYIIHVLSRQMFVCMNEATLGISQKTTHNPSLCW